MSEKDPEQTEQRRSRFYRLGRAAGKQFRPNGPGRRVARQVGSSLLRRGLWRFFR